MDPTDDLATPALARLARRRLLAQGAVGGASLRATW